MTEIVSEKSKERYYLVDALRGLALINMVLYHFSYDVFVIYGQNPDWLGSPAAFCWQQGICWSFTGSTKSRRRSTPPGPR